MDAQTPPWRLTAVLMCMAGFAILAAPRLTTQEAEPDYTTEDLCVSVGKWECCYKDGEEER